MCFRSVICRIIFVFIPDVFSFCYLSYNFRIWCSCCVFIILSVYLIVSVYLAVSIFCFVSVFLLFASLVSFVIPGISISFSISYLLSLFVFFK